MAPPKKIEHLSKWVQLNVHDKREHLRGYDSRHVKDVDRKRGIEEVRAAAALALKVVVSSE